jgi:hypothetical protein
MTYCCRVVTRESSNGESESGSLVEDEADGERDGGVSVSVFMIFPISLAMSLGQRLSKWTFFSGRHLEMYAAGCQQVMENGRWNMKKRLTAKEPRRQGDQGIENDFTQQS